MKNTLLAFLAVVLSAVAAEAVLEIPLNDGKFESLVKTGALSSSVNVKAQRTGKMAWNAGRLSEKSLYFMEKDRKNREFPYLSIEKKGKIDLSKPFTFSCWAMPAKDLIRTQQYTIWGDTSSDRGPGSRLFISYDSVRFYNGDGKTLSSINSNSSKNPIELGVWSHFAVTFDGTKVGLFMNGTKVAEMEKSSMISGNAYISVGAYRDGSAYGFNGAIGEIKFYDTALTEAEVMKLAKELDF